MPVGTSLKALVASFTTTGASVKVGTVVQESGKTANDFSNPVTYTVTAQDASAKDYKVTVKAASVSTSVTAALPSATMSLSGQSETLGKGSSMTVTASVTQAPSSYAWYLDGTLVSGSTGAAWTGGGSLGLGKHSLMAAAVIDGVVYSATCYFRVI